MPLPNTPEMEDEKGYEEIDRNTLRKLQQLSLPGAALFEELQDPALSAEEFGAKIRTFNQGATQAREGSYRSLNVSLGRYRDLIVKIFDNGRVTFSAGYYGPERFGESHESGSFSIPESGDSVVLKKRSVRTGNTSKVNPGEVSEGKLIGNITLGQSVQLDNNARTSKVQAMRIENGILIVDTETSTYEISKKD